MSLDLAPEISPTPLAGTALIVGATQGIGLEIVQQLLRQPQISLVYATYRRTETATALMALQSQYPDQLNCLSMDITDEAQIAATLNHIQQQTPTLHLLLNSVGLLHDGSLQPEKNLQQIQPEHLMRLFQVNSIGSVLLAKHALPLLRHPHRSILASISAKVGSIGDNHLGGWYGYRASKAALNMFMRTVALEYRRKSPQTLVVTLHPGTTDTALSQPFQRQVPPEKLFPVRRTAQQLLQVLAGLTLADSGQFFSWDGSRLPW
ncbi:SDR family NAD(P)-dependent oxidoreductase [Synechococcales cyanobacterium C]|uniref:SDR family NAD(P)-dependent oxidoreductase n=1 Tax=Petrachloros mirabilis ULC683 TaxID=2781853 RepID=A0A8K2A7W8_9CYAN|nr:SDR family NAD(P)-dependent oxidoreductase [Petrachloros mirabilis]NCJ06395.1 SDR family NAD(P)-dependent oxidoreductase [Petrachloros mirabilis ULC683]